MQLNLYLLGAPGAGKGTQAQLLVQYLGIPQLSTGDLLREARKDGSELGKRVAAIMDSGALLPDQVVIDLVKQRLSLPNHESGVIFDGFPRPRNQAEILDELLLQSGRSPLRVVAVDVPAETLRERLLGRLTCPQCNRTYHMVQNPPQRDTVCDGCGSGLITRNDDKPETVGRRLANYTEQTAPLLDYYKSRQVLVSVDGTAPMGQVFEAIKLSLGL